MTATLHPMAPDRFDTWRAESAADYVDSRVKAGESHEKAQAASDREMESMFPGGRPNDDHAVFDVVDDGEVVGVLWIGLRDRAAGSWYVYDIAIDEAFRGRGLGRATMLLAETEARARGARSIGLNVFGFNTVARRLYESLGYEPTAIQMQKAL